MCHPYSHVPTLRLGLNVGIPSGDGRPGRYHYTADPDKGSEAACPEGECPGIPPTTSVAIVLNIWLEGPATTRAICMLN